MTWDGLLHRLTRRNVVLGLYVALALAASGQQLWSAATSTRTEPPLHRYNNYVIFERSWDHLVSGQDLYAWHPEEHWDLFKYTPTFAVLMAPFSALPDAIGLPLWNLLNALVLVLAVFRLPILREHQQGLALVICAVECMTSLQNAQSNGLVVGLLVLAFAELERGKAWLPALCVLLSAFIKLFGIVGLAMFVMHPQRWKLAGWTAALGLGLAALPLVVVSADQYAWLLERYGQMLSQDHSQSLGYSLHGILQSWFGLGLFQIAGPSRGQRAVHVAGAALAKVDRPHAPPARSVLDVVVGFGVQPQKRISHLHHCHGWGGVVVCASASHPSQPRLDVVCPDPDVVGHHRPLPTMGARAIHQSLRPQGPAHRRTLGGGHVAFPEAIQNVDPVRRLIPTSSKNPTCFVCDVVAAF